MNFGEAVLNGFSKCLVFEGRASRSEFWWFALFAGVLQIAASMVDYATRAPGSFSVLGNIVTLVLFLPVLAVSARRLHDIDRSDRWLGGLFVLAIGALAMPFIDMPSLRLDTITSFQQMDGTAMQQLAIMGGVGLVVFVYSLIMLIFAMSHGTDGPNDYGPDPLIPFGSTVVARLGY